jgi:hypothetical protein
MEKDGSPVLVSELLEQLEALLPELFGAGGATADVR